MLGGCGSAVLAPDFPELGIGFTGVSLAFGLTVLTAAYALGPVSGGHFNPAVTVGLWAGGRFPASAMVAEIVLTFMFLIVILGATHTRAPVGFAGLAIGLALTLIHLISIPVTNTSVNPARSTGPALFVGGWAIAQLWLFWVAPLVGALAAGLLHKTVFEARDEPDIVGR